MFWGHLIASFQDTTPNLSINKTTIFHWWALLDELGTILTVCQVPLSQQKRRWLPPCPLELSVLDCWEKLLSSYYQSFHCAYYRFDVVSGDFIKEVCEFCLSSGTRHSSFGIVFSFCSILRYPDASLHFSQWTPSGERVRGVPARVLG